MVKHKHRINPGHMGGKYNPSNVVELSIEDHALAHKELYEKHGKHEDFVAWKSLSGQIGNEELFIEKSRIGGLNNKGIKKSEEHKKRISETNKGQRSHWLNGNSNQKKKNLSKSMTGNTNSKNHNTQKYSKTQSEAMKKAWIRRKEKEMHGLHQVIFDD